MTSTVINTSDNWEMEAKLLTVDVFQPYNPGRNDAELQDFLMVCWLVAGKTAYIQNNKFNNFKKEFDNNLGIFDNIKLYGLDYAISMAKKHGLGKYTLLTKFIVEYQNQNFDLKNCTAEDLEILPGIGCKTARFFLINNRPDYRCSVLDTHILRFLAEKFENIPLVTPNKSKYYQIEQLFLDYCDQNSLHPREFDLQLWKQSSKKPSK